MLMVASFSTAHSMLTFVFLTFPYQVKVYSISFRDPFLARLVSCKAANQQADLKVNHSQLSGIVNLQACGHGSDIPACDTKG